MQPNPDTYLSTSGGMWRVIHKGLPICADTPDRSRAELAAKAYSLVPTALWNGDASRFESLQPEWKRHAAPLSR